MAKKQTESQRVLAAKKKAQAKQRTMDRIAAAQKRQEMGTKTAAKRARKQYSEPYDPDKAPKWNGKTQNDPSKRRLADKPICGAQRAKRYAEDPDNPGVCCLMAGWGTEHPGIGHCKWHGGNSPNGIKHAKQQEALDELAEFKLEQIRTFGHDVDIDPVTALTQEVRRGAGVVKYLAEKVADLPESELFTQTVHGMITNPLIGLYQHERGMLVQAAKIALAAGVAERQVKLAEDQGRLMATLIMAVLLDKELQLTPQQKHDAKAVVRKHLMTMDVIDVSESAAEAAALTA